MANATRAGTTLLRSCLCRSAVAVRPFAHLRILYAGPGCKSGPAGFKAGQAFTAVYNRASRLYSRPARFKTGRPAIKPAAGFQAGQVYNRALTYIRQEICNKRAAAALISAAYVRRAYSSVCVALPESVRSRIATLFQELQHFWQKCCDTLHAQIQRKP